MNEDGPLPLLIVAPGAPGASERALAALAQHSGIPAECLGVREFAAADSGSIAARCSIMGADTLLEWSACGGGLAGHMGSLRRFEPLLVYGFRSCPEHEALLRALSANRLAGVQPSPTASSFSVLSTSVVQSTCHELAGLTLPTPSRPSFVETSESVWVTDEVLMTLGGKPFLVLIQNCGSRLFLLSCGELPDPEGAVGPDHSLLDHFPPLSAVLFYFRYAYGNRCWHSEPATACLVIDDPLLRQTHGFLRFDSLVEEIERSQTAITISFIPWNFRRSDPAVADLFRKHSGRMSICVHGCDHTAREFGTSDEGILHAKAQLALARMEEHTRLTGLDFEPVMVFPQGVFATSALVALRDAGYLAAVNTTPHPVNHPEAPLRLVDLLEPAVTSYGGVALFTRHYPRDLAECAVHLFLGRPVLLAGHHEYFRGGYERFRALVTGLRQLAPDLEWKPLGEVLMRSCQQRVASGGALHVRFYTDHFLFRNPAAHQQRVVFERAHKDVAAITNVLVDDCPTEFELITTGIRFALDMHAGAQLDIQVCDREPPITVASLALEPSGPCVLARRRLSELYDNYVAKSQLLVSLGHAIKRALLRL